MRGRIIRAAVAASIVAPALAVAQPRTITITTTTTVTLEPDATVSDLPPGETPPNAEVAVAVEPAPAAAPARDVRLTAALGLAMTEEAVVMSDLRASFGLTRHLAIAGGVTFASETDDLDRPEKAFYSPNVALQIWPTSRFWLEAGAGLAAEGHRDPSAVATAAIGADVLAGDGFAVDAQLRALVVEDGGGLGFLVGASWY